jgi:quercetin dioxygenase-like cupin family protein
MKRLRHRVVLVITLAAIASLVPQLSGAQDAAVVNQKTVRVTLENDRVRVLEAELPPGGKEQTHSHPASVIYVIAGGTVRNHAADGKVSDLDLKAGDTMYRDAMTHWTENIGATTVHLILVELKTPAVAEAR